MKYWRIVLRYGHVGRINEVSVARFIETHINASILTALDIASNMPGVKAKGVLSIKSIDYTEYLNGKKAETENLYLQKLKTHNPWCCVPKNIA